MWIIKKAQHAKHIKKVKEKQEEYFLQQNLGDKHEFEMWVGKWNGERDKMMLSWWKWVKWEGGGDNSVQHINEEKKVFLLFNF